MVNDTVDVGQLSVRHALNENLMQIGGHIRFVIRPSYRRQYYGKTIIRLGLLKARHLGPKSVLLMCDVANQ